MDKTPKSLRLHIGIFGRTNVGKSSFLNTVAGQDVAITSAVPGTTTDVVEKTMELLPIGPVVFLDTAGLDDISVLAEERIKKTMKAFDRVEVLVLITEPGIWTSFEDTICQETKRRNIPLIIVVNKIDQQKMSLEEAVHMKRWTSSLLEWSCAQPDKRDIYVHAFKTHLLNVCPEMKMKLPPLIGDLIPRGGLVICIVPIDLEAPKGRIILPQVQTIRDVLDHHGAVLVVKETEYQQTLSRCVTAPSLVVCDSQVVDYMVRHTPQEIPCTTFSLLYARYKGDLLALVKGVQAIKHVKAHDRVLIAEACTHHAVQDDIGRVKIPRWLRAVVGQDIIIDTCAGQDYPQDLGKYALIIHCGSCMLTRTHTLMRIQKARDAGVPITNYGICISFLQGVLERVLTPFPEALTLYQTIIMSEDISSEI